MAHRQSRRRRSPSPEDYQSMAYHKFKRNTLLDDEDLAANHDIDTAA